MNSNGHKERPIIFSGEMVKAILDGRKTQTRRVMRKQPIVALRMGRVERFCSTGYPQDSRGYTREQLAAFCPYGRAGDRLWVRELWAVRLDLDRFAPFQLKGQHPLYWADGPGRCCNTGCAGAAGRKRAAMHMPRWASRITLEITNARVERLQEITAADAKAEGVDPFLNRDATAWRAGFQVGWDALNAKRGYSWEKNPWVWVIEFKKV